jgi:hypothetical protein
MGKRFIPSQNIQMGSIAQTHPSIQRVWKLIPSGKVAKM